MQIYFFSYARASQKKAQGTEKLLACNTKKNTLGQKKLSQIFQRIFVRKDEKLRVANLSCCWIPVRYKLSCAASFCCKNAMFCLVVRKEGEGLLWGSQELGIVVDLQRFWREGQNQRCK